MCNMSTPNRKKIELLAVLKPMVCFQRRRVCRGTAGFLVIVTSALFFSKNPQTFDVLKWLNNYFLNFLHFQIITYVVFVAAWKV